MSSIQMKIKLRAMAHYIRKKALEHWLCCIENQAQRPCSNVLKINWGALSLSHISPVHFNLDFRGFEAKTFPRFTIDISDHYLPKSHNCNVIILTTFYVNWIISQLKVLISHHNFCFELFWNIDLLSNQSSEH